MWAWQLEAWFQLGSFSRPAVLLVSFAAAGCVSVTPLPVDELRPATTIQIDESTEEGQQARGTARAGEFQGHDSERIFISFPGSAFPDTIHWDDVQRVRAYNGRNTGLGIVLGAGGGLVVGLAGMALLSGLSNNTDGPALLPVPLITIPLGGIFGAIWAPEAWAPVQRRK